MAKLTMKVLIVAQHINFFRNLDNVLRELGRRGHSVVFLHGTRLDSEKIARKSKERTFLGRGLQVAESEIPGVTTGYRPEPPEAWQGLLRNGRHVMNRASYYRKAHPAPERTVEGIEREMPPDLRKKVLSGPWRAVLRRPAALSVWRWIEEAVTPSPTLVSLIEEIAPDVVLVAPMIWPKRPVEADYVHAAKSLGIPTVGYVNSWDNLTSKGTVHVLPDVFAVWNEALAEEALSLHDVPPARIRITGAPHLDALFDMRPNAGREAVLRNMGCPPHRPYLLYLCSSRTLVESELGTVTAMADALAARIPDTAPTLVVRPHPTNAQAWDGYEHPGVVLYPKGGDQADSPDSWQDYFNQLTLASCVFGLNTTAFLEAVVADRPCLTIVSDEFWASQGRTGHFRHLLKGDFLEVSRDMAEVADRVGRILSGADEKAAGRRSFVEWFIRPEGRARPASPVVCDVLETLAIPGAGVPGQTSYPRDLVPGLVYTRQGGGSVKRPMFTIAIPAKDRPDRLANAVRSVLEQTYTDFEVIVCDNSEESHVGATSAAVKSFDDSRLRYVRTNGRLSMPDNWERAILDAAGQYVGILSDRSVLRRDALEIVASEIERTDAKVVGWFPDQYGRDVTGRVYRPRRCSLQRLQFDSADLMNGFLHGNPKYSGKVLPKLMTGVCSREIIDRARAVLGRMCLPVCPDYTSGYLMLGLSSSVLIIDDALFVSCGSGNGAAFRRKGPLADRFLADLGLSWKELVGRMPSEACFTHALVMNDFCGVKESMPEQFGRFELDHAQYYLGCLTDYNRAARNGVDRTEDLDALMEGLDREPDAVQAVVRSTRMYLGSILQLPSVQKMGTPTEQEETPDPAEDRASMRFDTVWGAMAWAEEHPRTPAGGEILSMPPLETMERWDRRAGEVNG